MSEKVFRYFFVAVSAIVLSSPIGCLSDLSDYWSSLYSNIDDGMDSGSDSDTDTDTDSDGDTDIDGDTDSDSDECTDAYTCGDSGPDTDTGGGDGPDAGLLCDSAAFEAYLAGTVHVFDNSTSPYRGNAVDPEVVITGFSYFLCSHCAVAAGIMEDMMNDPDYSGRVVYYYRHFSFSTDPATIGFQNHRAAEAAHMQGDFWPVHDALYDNFPVLDEATTLTLAMSSVSDSTAFILAYASTNSYDGVMDDRSAGTAAGVTGTPTLFVNGVSIVPWTKVPEVVDCLLGYATYLPPDGGVDGGI